MPRPVRPAPRTFSAQWPDAQCTDQVAEIARVFAVNLRNATAERGVRETARRTGITHSILSRIIAGDVWADTQTLARLEHALDIALWPTHKPQRGRKHP